MSMFRTTAIRCPQCGASVDFKAVMSVNADRRPDLRVAIVDGSFQRQPCPKCGQEFRLDPQLTFVDIGRGQWIATHPVAKLGHWKELEEQARSAFVQAYGSQAPPAARKMGIAMQARLVFGWGGLREKLIIADNHLDDVTLELVKLAIVRTSESTPLSNDTELRLIGVEGGELVMAWIRAQNEQVVERLDVPRQLYDDIAADKEPWVALRQELSAGLFVDINRLLVIAV